MILKVDLSPPNSCTHTQTHSLTHTHTYTHIHAHVHGHTNTDSAYMYIYTYTYLHILGIYQRYCRNMNLINRVYFPTIYQVTGLIPTTN